MALTAKQKLFCENYVSNGYKLQKAYMDAYPDAAASTANTEAYKLMKKEPVKALIRELQHERFEAMNVNADRIAKELSDMAFAETDNESGLTYSVKQKALELLQKQLGLQTQKVEAEVKTTVINVGIEDDD